MTTAQKKLFRAVTLATLSLLSLAVHAQNDTLNHTDSQGRKQGYWVRKRPDGTLLYQGYFVDGRPAGEFRRYYDDGTLKALMFYHPHDDTVEITFFYNNAKKAATGKYLHRKKEGEWRYYSYYTDSLSLIENYRNGVKEGPVIKFYPSGDTAEVIHFSQGKKEGPWLQYYDGGRLKLTATYQHDRLEGPFIMYWPDGSNMLQGQYHQDVRQGKWYLFDKKGHLTKTISYTDGIPDNLEELTREESALLDSLERNKGKFLDPEKYGISIFRKGPQR